MSISKKRPRKVEMSRNYLILPLPKNKNLVSVSVRKLSIF